jgi:hypothetical protein
MNNLLSYCGLVDAKIRASDKDLPVTSIFVCCIFGLGFAQLFLIPFYVHTLSHRKCTAKCISMNKITTSK